MKATVCLDLLIKGAKLARNTTSEVESIIHTGSLVVSLAYLPLLFGKGWDGIIGYLTSHEAYCFCVGTIQVIIYTHEDEVT